MKIELEVFNNNRRIRMVGKTTCNPLEVLFAKTSNSWKIRLSNVNVNKTIHERNLGMWYPIID